jgi:hypothetical protein
MTYRLPHPNVFRAMVDFGRMLRELPSATPSRRAEIYHEACVCQDLMVYSHEVADTKHRMWLALEKRIGETLIGATS